MIYKMRNTKSINHFFIYYYANFVFPVENLFVKNSRAKEKGFNIFNSKNFGIELDNSRLKYREL